LLAQTSTHDEALVVGHEEGAGRLAGSVGALVCRARDKKMFKVGSA
jgi:ATP-dependent DNA ligase